MEESDGQDSSVVRRPIVIVSMNDTIGAATIRRPLKQQGLERKSHLSTIASSKANKGLEGGWLPSGRRSSVAEHVLAAQARGPGFDSRRRHFSFQALAVSNIYGHCGPDCVIH